VVTEGLSFKKSILKCVSTFSGKQGNGTDPCSDTVILCLVTSHSEVREYQSFGEIHRVSCKGSAHSDAVTATGMGSLGHRDEHRQLRKLVKA